jgi:hypothetical protein
MAIREIVTHRSSRTSTSKETAAWLVGTYAYVGSAGTRRKTIVFLLAIGISKRLFAFQSASIYQLSRLGQATETENVYRFYVHVHPVCENSKGIRMTSRKLEAGLAVAVIVTVLASGCLSSLPFRATPTAKPRDLSGSYDASFVLGGWSPVSKFTQVKPHTYVGVYTDEKGQTWNFTVELISSENDSYGRYFELMKQRTDAGYVKTNESKIALGTGQTVFGRIDEKWYGYKASDAANPALCALFFGYDDTSQSWVVVTATSGAIATKQTSATLS